MQLGSRGVQRERQAAKKLMGYSKQWAPGDTMRLFIPLIWLEDGRPDFMVGKVWGFPVNAVKELGLHTIFIPSTVPFNEDGKPIGTPDITYQFSRIAPVFVRGQRAAEIAKVASKPWPSETAKETALDEVKKKYSKENPNAVKPIIGREKFVIMTEVISVKYVEGTGCKLDTCALSTWSLSDKVLRQILTLLDNPKFTPAKGQNYFEIEINYPSDPDKGKSGLAAVPSGITADYALCNQYPDAFRVVESYFGSWSTDSETVRRRATTMIPIEVIQDAIRNYCLMNSEFLDSVSNEDDIKVLVNNIDVVSKIVSTQFLKNAELQHTLQEAIDKMEKAEPVPTDVPAPDVSLAMASPAADIADIAPEAPPIVDIPLNAEAPRYSELLMGDSDGLGSDQLADVLGDMDLSNIG